MKPELKIFCVLLICGVVQSPAQNLKHQYSHTRLEQQIPPPGNAPSGLLKDIEQWKVDFAADFPGWLEDLKYWRLEHYKRIGYDDSQYRRSDLLWTQRNFVQTQMMVEDRYFYDPEHQIYTVNRYVDDLVKRYGGVDSVLIWPIYPNIGIDNRNQWDLHRDMPGGVTALRQVVEDFHRRGIKVFFPTMGWDGGTRDPGADHWVETIKLMAELKADGINGDTFRGVPQIARKLSDDVGLPVAFEPENPPMSDELLIWNNQSWGSWVHDFVPTASKVKWLETRHMPNLEDRWARDKSSYLQDAFFNGIGFMAWENIWGIWNQITPRDGEAMRRISAIYRALPDYLISKDWEPHTPTLQFGIFSSKFPVKGSTLWTLVNRNEYDIQGDELVVPYVAGRKFYDLWSGTELTPRIRDTQAILEMSLEGHGYGAVLSVDPGVQVAGLEQLLRKMNLLGQVPLISLSDKWHSLRQNIVEIPSTKVIPAAPPGMVTIPAGNFDFRVTGLEIEGNTWDGVDFQYPWENSPRRTHQRHMEIRSFHIDKHPVTNSEFKAFVEATGYHPADDHNFLNDWRNGSPQKGWENKPVTWVSLDDARAYARWAGKRLPHEWEWQYAAQGSDGRLYPWGNVWDERAVPLPHRGRDLPGPADVGNCPLGASPFGVLDLVGNVWQWTDEFIDEHTRAAALRGGSYYQPQNSYWYFPQAYRLDQHGKYLLMAPSKDRAGTLGFRCVVDAQ